MDFNKYSKQKQNGGGVTIGSQSSIDSNASSGGESGGGQSDIDRMLWGNYDDGGDISETIFVNGSIYLTKADYSEEEEDDEESEEKEEKEDKEYETYEDDEGGNIYGNTAKMSEVIAEDITASRHIYANLSHPDHEGEKVCIVEEMEANRTEIENINVKVENTLTQIGDLTIRVEKIESRKAAGYYWTANADINNGTPTTPIGEMTFIGADIGDFEVTETEAFLWRTIDGETFTIVTYWVPPEADKYYIASSMMCAYYDSSMTGHGYPCGLIAFCTPALKTPFGKSGWTATSYTYATQGAPEPTLNYPSDIFNTQSGIIPRTEGYPYIWEIDDIADANNYLKWKLLQSGGSNNEMNHTVEFADWGNATSSPGYGVFLVDTNNMVNFKALGQTSGDPYVTGNGTSGNWGDAVWRKSFLMFVLSDFFVANKHLYNDKTGWSFNWNGACSSTGYCGQWTCRIGGINPPDSDNSGDIGYYPTSGISYLSGYAYSSDTGSPLRVDFLFSGIKVGKKLPYSMEGYSNAGKPSIGRKKFWNVSYEKVWYKLTDSDHSSNS